MLVYNVKTNPCNIGQSSKFSVQSSIVVTTIGLMQAILLALLNIS